jgi:hypothetical protein
VDSSKVRPEIEGWGLHPPLAFGICQSLRTHNPELFVDNDVRAFYNM